MRASQAHVTGLSRRFKKRDPIYSSKKESSLFPFYRAGNEDSETLSNLLRVAQPGSSRAKIRMYTDSPGSQVYTPH